jgi:hypothetical protein
MVQRIGGSDQAGSSSAAEGPKRQDDRNPERASKFKSMLGQGKGSEASDAARRAPGGDLAPGQAQQVEKDAATRLADAARDLESALDQLGIKTTRENQKADETAATDAATAAQLASATTPGWQRPEGAAQAEGAGRLSPMELEGMERMHRLMVGQGPNGAEARLAITDGPMAGAHIHLKTGPGGLEASVSTTNNSSRQTLVSAMDEVARRMKDKGHQLKVDMKPPPQTNRWQNQDRSGPF